jgi:hypothetical protein
MSNFDPKAVDSISLARDGAPGRVMMASLSIRSAVSSTKTPSACSGKSGNLMTSKPTLRSACSYASCCKDAAATSIGALSKCVRAHLLSFGPTDLVNALPAIIQPTPSNKFLKVTGNECPADI